MEQYLLSTVISYQVLTHYNMRAKWLWIAHLSIVSNVLSIGSYRYLLETGHAPSDPPGGSSLATEPQFKQI